MPKMLSISPGQSQGQTLVEPLALIGVALG